MRTPVPAAVLVAALAALTACSDTSDDPTDADGTSSAPTATDTATASSVDPSTCDLAGGTFTAQDDLDALTSTITFTGLDVPASARTVLYSARLGAVQVGLELTRRGTDGFTFDSRTAERTDLPPDASTITATGDASTVVDLETLPALATEFVVSLEVDGTETATCRASLPF